MRFRRVWFQIIWNLTPTPGGSRISITSPNGAKKYFKNWETIHNGKTWLKDWTGGLHSLERGIMVLGSGEEHCEKHIEDILNHEVLHDTLNRLFDNETSKALDIVQVWYVPRPDRLLFRKVEDDVI